MRSRPLRCLTPILTAVLMLLAQMTLAGVAHCKHPHGEHFAYIPDSPPKGVLLLAQSTASASEPADQPAKAFLHRWIPFADTHGLILIAPVFDTDRFGNRSGGYGGYRGLFGKHIRADVFAASLVEFYQSEYDLPPDPILLYGHSAGAQFALRFTLAHPRAVIHTVVSAPGRFTYPDPDTRWPYGAGQLRRQIKWKDGTRQHVFTRPDITDFIKAAPKITVVVGAQDTGKQPKRPAHIGTNRVEFARSWVQTMSALSGPASSPGLRVIPGVNHSSARLTPYDQDVLTSVLP